MRLLIYVVLTALACSAANDEDSWSESSKPLTPSPLVDDRGQMEMLQAVPTSQSINPNPKVQRMERARRARMERQPRARDDEPILGRLMSPVQRPLLSPGGLDPPQAITRVITRQPGAEKTMTTATPAPTAAPTMTTTSWKEIIDAQTKEYIRIRDEMNKKDKKIPRPTCDGLMNAYILSPNDISEEECEAMKEHYQAWREQVYAARRQAFWFPKIAALSKPLVSKGLSRFDPRVVLRRSARGVSDKVINFILTSEKFDGTDEQKTDYIMSDLDLRFGTLDTIYDEFRAVAWPLLSPVRILIGNLLCQVPQRSSLINHNIVHLYLDLDLDLDLDLVSVRVSSIMTSSIMTSILTTTLTLIGSY